jgi:hypothetical protein
LLVKITSLYRCCFDRQETKSHLWLGYTHSFLVRGRSTNDHQLNDRLCVSNE